MRKTRYVLKKPPPQTYLNRATPTRYSYLFFFSSKELLMRLELMTSSLPRMCSTTELQQPGRAVSFQRLAVSHRPVSFHYPLLCLLFLIANHF